MRAALSILSLVIVFAVVMFSMKHQAQELSASKAAPAAGASQAGGLPNPEAVKQQVNDLVMQEAAKASDAQP